MALDTTASHELEKSFWKLYREFFDLAERRRRWSLPEDIPWLQCNPKLDPVIADVVESFCAVELYLPDYTSKILPLVRNSKGRAWFYANWGYEESKHSLALGDWLLKSGMRSENQIVELEKMVFEREWNLPSDSHLGMLIYAMTQERATWLNYRNLRSRCQERGGDPALEQLLLLLAVDERAHYVFFESCVKLYMQFDRPAVIEIMKQVMNSFMMPAIHELAQSQQRVGRITSLAIFDESMYFREVYMPILENLGVSRTELRSPMRNRKTLSA